VLKIARLATERSPPMGVGSQPTPSRMVRISPPLPTSPWACAHTTPSTCKVARARTSTEQAYTRTRATREEPGRDSRVRHWARLRHTSDDAGSGRATTPGDHAANLGATMLDSCYTRLRRPTSRRRTRHAVHLESTLLLSIQNALALISSLYYTHAPQLPHASPPTRAPHIYVSSPSPGRLLASLQVPFRACEGYFQ